MLGEDLEELSARRRLLLQLERGLGSLGLLCLANLVELGLALSQELILVGELPDGCLALLSVLKLDTHVGQDIVPDLVTEIHHSLRAIFRFRLYLVSEL